ncbi:MAG: FkbM family methyltransferase [Gammaproteobacteria bacterium]|nr:FkbM family methyltransferase [Gammaproteobacteria bacterium]
MKQVEGWWIPETDEARHPVKRRMKKSRVIDIALLYARDRGTCIQAGGHLGYWPLRLAAKFERVVTFEPEPGNFACLARNCAGRANIEPRRSALGAAPGRVALVHTPASTGTHHVDPAAAGGDCPLETIDALDLAPAAIFLDIEGLELAALEGAEHTIRRYRPLVVIEENRCLERYGHAAGDCARFLARYGYVEKTRYSHDIIYGC